MNLLENRLGAIAEEASEVAKNALKAQKYGFNTIEPGQEKTNATRLLDEMNDLMGAFEELIEMTGCPGLDPEAMAAKRKKLDFFIGVCYALGTLTLTPQEKERYVKRDTDQYAEYVSH